MEQTILDQCYVNDATAIPIAPRKEFPIIFRVPGSFHFGKALPPALWKCRDDAHWFLSNIIRKTNRGETDEKGYVHLQSRILKKVMSKRTYHKVIETLIEGEWIDPPSSYSTGRWSQGYRLHEKHYFAPDKLIPASDTEIIYRIRREEERMRQEQQQFWLPIHYELFSIFEELSILPSADAVVAGYPDDTRLSQQVYVRRIREHAPICSVGYPGRCFTPFTGLKKTLRPYLRLSGESIAGVDICCAQPALLVNLSPLFGASHVPAYIQMLLDRLSSFRSMCSSYWPASGGPGLSLLTTGCSVPPLGDDYFLFADLVASGYLHDCLIDLCQTRGIPLPGISGYVPPRCRSRGLRHRDLPKTSKEFVKKYLMQDIIAKRGNYPSDFERVFQEKFPSVLGFIRWFNSSAPCYPKPQFSELIRVLQRLESFVVIEHVAPRLIRKIPILTLHDAIYCRESDVGMVKDEFYDTFTELGLRMQVKEERLTNAV